MARIFFLFNHDAAHQVAHIAGIADALACAVADSKSHDVILACGTPAIAAQLRALLSDKAAQSARWVDLDVPRWARPILSALNHVAPVLRLARLWANKALFAEADVVVSPERTCLHVKKWLGARAPHFVFVPHGAGDRNVTYHPDMAHFDHMLVSGPKVRDEMLRHALARPGHIDIIGYPKFDSINLAARPRFFDNDKPVVLYNPHFDPCLSSWYDMGPQLLAWFAAQQGKWNLIVAPHVMLFRKRWHYSLEYRRLRSRPDIDPHYRSLPFMRIDTDSPHLFDMSYTRAADIYIGDVSSQVYEFLAHRGACYFLDTGKAETPLEFWQNGRCYTKLHQLTEQLVHWRADAAHYRATQDRLFAYTIDHDPQQRASQRGAQALLAYVARLGGAHRA